MVGYYPKSQEKKTTSGEPNQKYRSEAVIIKAEGKSYADLLKGVKKEVNLEQLGLEIKNTRSSRNGELLLEFDKNNKGLEQIKQIIENKLGTAGFQAGLSSEKSIQMIIQGLDATTTQEEAETALRQRSKDDNLKVISMKSTFISKQSAIILTSKLGREELLKEKRFRIGHNVEPWSGLESNNASDAGVLITMPKVAQDHRETISV